MSGGVATQVLCGSEASRTGPRDAGFSMSNHRIVVVEDDVFIRLDLTTQLRAAGHTVVGTADSAAEAVRVVEHERPDLVLMDVRLVGDRDGIEAATEIWQRFAIRSLFVSANLDAAARAKASAANPVGFLEKPFTPNGLLAAVAAGR
jgi:CheY-like chemotaxis protein